MRAQSRKVLTVQERRKEEQLEHALRPKQTPEDRVEKAKLILPQILNDKAWSDQGRINIPKMMKPHKISQNTAYRVRRELLKHYHEQDSARASQWGPAIMGDKLVSNQQEEKTK